MYQSIRSRKETPFPERAAAELEDSDYHRQLRNILPSNCFFITKTGFCGIAPSNIAIGDHLAIWFGAPVPFVLRQNDGQALSKQDGKFVCSVLGVAYVGGIMDSEMVEEVYREDLKEDMTFIVQ